MATQIALALYPLLLAALAVAWAARARGASRRHWLAEVGAAASIMLFAYLAGPWGLTSYYLRYVVLVLFAAAAAWSYRKAKGKPRRFALSVPVLVVFGVLDLAAVLSHFAPRDAFNVPFPLAEGRYYVLQGGNSVVTNSFHAIAGNALSLDIVRLNAAGNRAKGLAPSQLEDYASFGDTVYSPCSGAVVSARSDSPDVPPGSGDRDQVNGNHVILRCGEVTILLAHLQRGSVVVSPGRQVRVGQPLAKVGNSGYSMEPHLHIGATRDGKPAGLVFDNRQLSINSVVSGVNAE